MLNIIREYKTKINLENIIDEEDKELINNKRINNMRRIDWSKTLAVSNQYIQKNILTEILTKYNYKVYSVDDDNLPTSINKNNCKGYDLLVSKNNQIYRIQSKLRQVNGTTHFSQQIHFETTRRNCKANKNKMKTGHVSYSIDEFDFVFITLVNDKLYNRKDYNNWKFSFIPTSKLQDENNDFLVTSIKSHILEECAILYN